MANHHSPTIEVGLPSDNLLDSISADVVMPSQAQLDKAPDPLIGKCLGNYEVNFVLGKGGFGTVYKAKDIKLGREVAVKVLHDSIDERYEDLLLSEAKAIAALGKHSGIVQIYAWGEYEERNYFVLEFVGSNASMLLQYHPVGMPVAQAINIAIDCADGLAYAHEQGILHRDIKPPNILLELNDGHAKLADFGVARFYHNPEDASGPAGTPGYMAPEVARGDRGTVQSDIFSLGVSLCEMLCGTQFTHDTLRTTLGPQEMTARQATIQTTRDDLPAVLMDLVNKAMAPEPAGRHESAQAFARDLRHAAASIARKKESVATVTPEEASQTRLMAAMEASSAKRSGAPRLAPSLLAKGVEAFRDGDAYHRLKQHEQARSCYLKAREHFDRANSRSERALDQINTLLKARGEMEKARDNAMAYGGSHPDNEAFHKANTLERQARGIKAVPEAVERYGQACALYQKAFEVIKEKGLSRLTAARTRAEAAQRKAAAVRADVHAPELFQTAVRRLAEARRTSKNLSATAGRYALAEDAFTAAVQKTLKEKQKVGHKTMRPPQVFADMEFVWIPPGTFMMGTVRLTPGERPVHQVRFGYGFWMARYPVTQETWETVMGENPAGFTRDLQCPVESISFNQCLEFISSLNEEHGGRFRLPSEAEWEYACRAQSTTEFFFGPTDAEVDQYCWTADNANGLTHPVGGKAPNKWGLYDMVGNVAEWCLDTFHEDYECAPNDGSAWISEEQDAHVVRGGSWSRVTQGYQSASRSMFLPPHTSFDFVGLRLCREAD